MQTKEFATAVKTAAIIARQGSPYGQGAKVRVSSNGHLAVSAGHPYLRLTIPVATEALPEFDLAADPRDLAAALKAAGKRPELALAPVDDASLMVISSGRRVTVPADSADPEFWKANDAPCTASSSVGATELAAAYEATSYATYRDLDRQWLRQVHYDPDARCLVATDGHRLAWHALPVHGDAKSWGLPVDAEGPLNALLEAGGSWIEVREYPGDRVSIEFPGGALLDLDCDLGNFPDWRQVSQPPRQDRDCALIFDREPLIAVLKDVVAYVGKKPKDRPGVRVNDLGQVQASNVHGRELAEKLASPVVYGERPEKFPLLRPHYLLEAVQHLDGDRVTITAPGDNRAPVVITTEPWFAPAPRPATGAVVMPLTD